MNRTIVDGLVPRTKGELVVMDSDVENFGIRVLSTGIRSYFVRYRIGGGRRAATRRKTLGRHPVVTPERARQQAKDILAKARLGEDPSRDQTLRRASLTVSELIEEWVAGPGMRTRKGRPKSIVSFASDRARLQHHVVPTIGRVKLCDLSRSHVEQVRDAIAHGKTACARERTKPRGFRHVRGGEGVATRATACFSSVLSYAVDRGLIPRNPALGVHKAEPRRCERFLSNAEVIQLQSAFALHQARHPQAVGILRLLILTGCRSNEIAGLTWAEVDLSAQIVTLSQSKTGPRIVYLSDAATAVLQEMPRVAGRSYVFPATRGSGSFQGTPKTWLAIRESAGLNDVRIHDLRHTFASLALAGGASLEIIAKLLGHADPRTTSRYAHLAANVVRHAANSVGVMISGPAPD